MQEAGLTTVTVFIDPAQKICIARSRPQVSDRMKKFYRIHAFPHLKIEMWGTR
jgi:hypothetical protein